MKITIKIDCDGKWISVERITGKASPEGMFEGAIDLRTAEETAALVAKIVGIAVAEAIAAAGGE